MGHYVNFKEELQQRTDYAEEVIRRWLPEERGFSKTMAQAMNYSMCAGGKRLRPILLLETLRLFGGDEKLAEPFMAGIGISSTKFFLALSFFQFFANKALNPMTL